MEITIQRDGLTLFGLLEGSKTIENDKIVILMHGFKGNLGYQKGKLLNDLAQSLNAAGFPTIRFDFSGCGKSDGKFQDKTVWSEILDGMKIIDYVRHTVKAKEIYLLGHSQGGVVASMLAGYFSDVIDKLILLSPAATLKDDALKGECQGVFYDPHHIPDSVIVDGFTVSGDYFRSAQTLPIYEVAKVYQGPVLLVHGDADRVVDPIASERYYAVYKNADYHLIKEADHILSGDNNQRQLMLDDVCRFLQEERTQAKT
ncbi:alpha/beta hydrolase [Streptococcus orisasini]|uniref:alpha/beta hydrolase n=1 Tax=Streptococcus orisasini TaxID=1080071 RepID=UPI00070AD314|nr:alpha/beta fold hydrolase [Streptococcus orisasini]